MGLLSIDLSAMVLSGMQWDAEERETPPCPWVVGPLTVAATPDQAGQQPVPGPRDGAAEQYAEWEGLSHSEGQVIPAQATHLPLRVEDSLPIILSAQLASDTLEERYFCGV